MASKDSKVGGKAGGKTGGKAGAAPKGAAKGAGSKGGAKAGGQARQAIDFTKREHAGAALTPVAPRLKTHYESVVRAALAKQFGGRGGGKPDLAQCGSLQAAPGDVLAAARALLAPSA